MIHRTLVTIAAVCCALVAVSFGLFARDQVAAGSKHQQQELATTAAPLSAPATVKPKGQPRRFIDSAAHTLTSPFSSIVQSDSQWVLHGVPTLFALLAYGVGIGYLARFSRGRS